MGIPKERCQSIIPLVYRHPLFSPERGMMADDSNEYVETLYESSLDEAREGGMHLIYLCAPLKPTDSKSAKDHILDAFYHASQIAGSEHNGKKIAIWVPHYHGLTMNNEFTHPGTRDFAMIFNGLVLRRYRPTLVRVGGRISRGMKDEIDTAYSCGLDVVHFDNFKASLQNLPSPKEIEGIYYWFIETVPSEFACLFSS